MPDAKPRSATAAAFDAAWLEASGEVALEALAAAKERAPDLVAAWVSRQNAAAVAAVADAEQAPAPARKAARRGINVLKSRGVAVPTRPVRGAPAPALELREAWFRPPDGEGTVAYTLGVRSPHGRYRLVDVIVRPGGGIASVAGMQLSPSQLVEVFDGVARTFGHRPAPVPFLWALARVEAGRRENELRGVPLPLGYATHLSGFGEPPAEPLAHPADQLVLPPVLDAIARSGTLHAEPELRRWLPAPEAIEAMLREVRTRLPADPRPDEIATASVRGALEQAADLYFDERTRAVLAERMRDVVISVHARGRAERAADLFNVARSVAAPSPAPREIPFLVGFFEKAFGLLAVRAARGREVKT